MAARPAPPASDRAHPAAVHSERLVIERVEGYNLPVRAISPAGRSTLPLALILVATTLFGCGSAEEKQAADWDSVAQALELYLPKLGEAYTTGSTSVLEGYAAPKEMARIDKRIQELIGAGRTLEPEFLELTVEKVDVWGYANAFVNTVEVWNIRSYATGTHALVGEDLAKRNRVKYQFKREGEKWLVLYRTISD